MKDIVDDTRDGVSTAAAVVFCVICLVVLIISLIYIGSHHS